ncbi:MAG: chloride channel protein, partial [Deltaproteobacteria bacterium]|nr:chloride channel protein [Deltaproteobacteria bacterium]
MTQGKGNGGSLLPSTVTAWTRAPLELTRRAAEDIPLLPSQDHITLVSLAALTGLLAGLAAELLRVFVRLFGVLMFSPGSLWELATDRSSPMSQRFDAEWPKIDTHFMVVGLAAALLMFGWGYYRDHRNGAAEGHRSRSHQLGIAVGAAALAHGVLQVLVAAADAVTPGHSGLLSVFQHTPWWGLCGVALVGGIAVGVLAHYLTDARGEGVPIVMKSVALKSGAMRTRSGPIFAGTAGLTVASMGSVGLEGPVLVFGAASASGLGQALGLSRDRLRVLVAAGAAAGISAGFNAPIAGALFALEIVVGDFALATFSPVVIASVVGTVVHRSIEGNFPVFGGVDFVIKSSYEIWLYIPLGLLCGAVGTLFVRTVESTNARFQRLTSGVPNFLQPAIGLLAICLMAVALGRYEVLGSGYDTLQNLLNNRITATVVGVILVAKIAATSLTLASGGVGGVFFPSLMIGASAGSLFGAGAQQLLGDRIASPASYAIVGMGAVLTAVQHAPLTAVVMVFELCN